MKLTEESLTLEKRKHPRFNVDLPVRYSRAGLFFRYGRAVNVSEAGLLIYFPEEMGIGQRLALKIFFPSRFEFNIVETYVQVVWKDTHLRKDWTWDYRTGVRFVDMPAQDMAKLKNLLVNIPQKPPSSA
jgi:hypothetical protein